jgi:thioesterase domain-containing protein/acyl carrier protein
MEPAQVPSRIVPLTELPLEASGKPSRRGLADLAGGAYSDGEQIYARGTALRLASLWRELLDVDAAVGPDDNFFALGGDSLRLVELCSRIEAGFGVQVQPGDVIARPTLEAMAALVAAGSPATRPILVPLRDGGPDRLPVYLVPGGGGSLAALARFVFLLGAGRRITGFEAPGLYPGEEQPKRVADLARRYVDELLPDAGDEPYALVGSSFGGIVAHDMARQLEEHGRPPTVLVMFDCIAPGSVRSPRRRPRPVKSLRIRVRRALGTQPATHAEPGLGGRIDKTRLAAQVAARHHRPGATTVPTVLFTTDANRTRSGDTLLGWGSYLQGRAETREFGGNHADLIRYKASDTAPVLDEVLAAHDPR